VLRNHVSPLGLISILGQDPDCGPVYDKFLKLTVSNSTGCRLSHPGFDVHTSDCEVRATLSPIPRDWILF
jgi:hypothetical protein